MLNIMGKAAKEASRILAGLVPSQKNTLLRGIGASLLANAPAILSANAEDMQEARNQGLAPAMLDRLLLTEQRLQALAGDVCAVATLPDPVGQIMDGSILENGLSLVRRRCPLGVVGVIYEARPNVTVDSAVLCLKTGNAVILRGGKETLRTNKVLVAAIRQALEQEGLPANAVQLIEDQNRELVTALLTLDRYVDMIIPRGGSGLQEHCRKNATIPVILGGIGVCHIFMDESADKKKALAVIENAKVQRPSVCNSVETLLIHEAIALEFLLDLSVYLAPSEVTFHACPLALPILQAGPAKAVPSNEEELSREWLTRDLNVCIVSGLEEALAHIRRYGSGHSEAILTSNMANAERFVQEVDASSLYINASTRFTDGGQFGLGAEVAISTQKLHARGPMGLDALTTWKWIGQGDYLVRS